MGDSGSNMDAPGRGTGENGIEKCYLKLDNSMRAIGLNEEEISQIAPRKQYKWKIPISKYIIAMKVP